MRWRKRADDGTGGEFLSASESTLSDFGHTGGEGFAEAWNAHEQATDDTMSGAAFEPLTDKRSLRSRDLDRRSPRVYLLGLVVALGLAGGALAAQQGVFNTGDEPTGAARDEVGEIVSIGDVRTYEAPDGSNSAVEVPDATPIDQRFTAVGAGDPHPGDALDMGDGARFGRLLWGGRAHVAVVGLDLSTDDVCVVVALVADDLRPVDLASHGSCPDEYTATGDRLACAGPGIVVLEVWPFDPDAVVDQQPVGAIRVRIESADAATDTIESVRGSAVIDGSFVAELAPMPGRPGDVVEIDAAGRSASCTLLQRAEIPVQLL